MTEIGAGTLLAEKYRLESLIGRGGMGSVWRAEHLGLNAPVAVKLLDMLHFDGASDAWNRFHREARAAAAIRSPHVVQIFDHGVDPVLGVPFIVMELMEGESLANRLARTGRLAPSDVGRVFTHVARALSRAHEAGIVHRDLKPDNVFLVRNEDDEVAKVLDFGIAKANAHGLGQDSNTRTGAIMGTAYYMSPEQISGNKNVDYRTDLWALGVMACECVTGRRPFEADTIGGITLRICVEPVPLPSSLAPVPAGFDQWFAKIVNRDPNQRFNSAREAADALRQLCMSESGAQRLAAPQSETAFQATVAATGAPLSRSSHENLGPSASQRKSRLPWLLGGIVAAGLAGGLWFRSTSQQASAEVGPSAVASVAAGSGATPVAAPPGAADVTEPFPPASSASASSSAALPEPASAATPGPPSAALPGPATSAPPGPATAQPSRPAKAAAPRSKTPTAPPAANVVAAPPAPAAPASPATRGDAPQPPAPARDLLDSR